MYMYIYIYIYIYIYMNMYIYIYIYIGLSGAERIRWLWNSEIAGRSSVEEVLRVHARHASEFSVVNAVTALHRVARAEDQTRDAHSICACRVGDRMQMLDSCMQTT